MVKIENVLPDGLASAVGIQAGDVLVSVNRHEVGDVLDYRFYTTATRLVLRVLRDGKKRRFVIKKEEYDDIGLCFETPLMDKKHTCKNGCVFCFIDQLPKGLRDSLYFKDDDDRLSFLHGNYVTLTNMTEKDVKRLLKMHISPVNVSVHTTNPELRVRMMRNKNAGEVLKYLPMMARGGLSLCTQIVLCKGWNDGAELDRTMGDLLKLYPSLRSCAVVPFGMTKYREKLAPMTVYNAEECRAVIAQVNAFGDACFAKYGTRLFYCSDEFYIQAGLPLPDEDYYEDYSQIQNGVGMITSFEEEFRFELNAVEQPEQVKPRHVSIATGTAVAPYLKTLCDELTAKVPAVTVSVYPVVNHFFGETVTVAGLLTPEDILEQVKGENLGEALYISETMLRREKDVFLTDMTLEEFERRVGVPVRTVAQNGGDLVQALLAL